MEKVIIIGANEFQKELVLTAKRKGYETHVFAWEEGAVAKDDADYFYPISIIEKDAILEEAKKIKPVGVCSIGSDLAMLTVNYVAQKLGLTSNSLHCTDISTNKYLMRQAFKAKGVPSAEYYDYDEIGNADKLPYPLIVKPFDRSGSRAVSLVNNSTELANAANAAKEASFAGKAIVEEYITGKEYSVEYISYKGKHTFLQLTEKFTTEAPHYIETGHREPADVSEATLSRVKEVVEMALDSLEVEYGASHTEIRVDGDRVRIIEVGARMGGDCIGSDLVKLSTGYDFTEMVLDVACGKAPSFVRVCEPKKAWIKFVLNSDDYNEYLRVRDTLDITQDTVDFANDREVVDSSTRFGYYIYTK